MSVKGEIKEGAGFVKEEMNEHGKSPKASAKRRKVVICATKAGSKTVKRRRRPSLERATPRNR